MSIEPLTSPFGDEPVTDIPLANSPLVRVVAQVRFPRLSALVGTDELARAFAGSCRDEYPIFDAQQEMAITVGPGGVSQAPGSGNVWHLRSPDEQWQLSFGDAFFAIDTAMYTNRENFRSRLEEAWGAFQAVVSPPFTERIGVRYINRMVDQEALDTLPRLIRPEALGGLAAPLNGAEVTHSLGETLYQLSEVKWLQARWGILPPGALFDPTLPAVPGVSWILDIDSFEAQKGDASRAIIGDCVERLAKQAYRYFRWTVTPDFLRYFGAEVGQ